MRIRFLSKIIFHPLAIPIAIIIGCLYLSINIWSEWQSIHSDSMICNALINIYKDNERLSFRLNLAFYGKNGNATLVGVLEENNKKVAKISRQVFFTYEHVKNSISIHSNKISISSQDNAGPDRLQLLLPAFYSNVGATDNYQVYPQKPGGYIFIKDFTPAFYCSEIQ